MRKIESQMLLAIHNRKDWNSANTRVAITYFAHGERIIDRATVYLHNSPIAEITPDSVTVNNCGYATSTTKSRINVILHNLCEAGIYQSKHQWYGVPKNAPDFEFESNTPYTFERTDVTQQSN
jgi:hypothetical protein